MGFKSLKGYVFFADYIIRFLSKKNVAARFIANELSNFGVGLLSLIYHSTLQILPVGFSHDQALVTL
jgi:hypothetical protein